MKEKQHASGFPEYIQSEREKDDYIADYFKHEGILLDKESIEFNSGLRATIKFLLNALWGKLAETSNKIQYEPIFESSRWLELISNEQFKVHRADFTNNKFLQVLYSNNTDINPSNTKNNIVLASFVTAYGRLKLLSIIQKLGQQCLYMDTDSVFFCTEDGLYEPKLGNYLGDLTNEISLSKGNFITDMVALAEKCFAYRTDKGQSHALCKGISFDHNIFENKF